MDQICFKLDKGAKLPTRAHKTDAGIDVYCVRDIEIPAMQHVKVSTGLHIDLKPGFQCEVRGRSSLTGRGIVVPTGTVDAGYTGEIGVIIFNFNQGHSAYLYEGDKIAQLVISSIVTPDIVEVDAIEDTERGSGGFGSTGR